MSNVNEVNEVNEVIINEVESTQSNITNESILTPEFITFDDLKSQFEQKIPINQILNIKKYLPIMHKSVLIENIISASKEIDDNGMTRINYTNLELFSAIHIIESFTNYAFHPETMIDEVDYIIENEIYDLIVEEIGKNEMWNIEDLLNKEIEQELKISNSIESVINNHLYLIQDHIDVLISKIPNFEEKKVTQWIKSLGKTLEKIDPSQFAMVKELSDFAKGTGK